MKSRTWIALSALGLAGAAVYVFRKRAPAHPRAHLLDLAPDDQAPDSEMGTVRFIGTATTLIRYQGMTILTDPNFLHRGQQVHIGYGMHSTRLTDPAVEWSDLPPIDFVLLSHLHEDHFDKFVERNLARNTPILTTCSAARTLRKRGFTNTYPLRMWDYVKVTKGHVSLRVTSMPGTHGPLLVAAALPDVMGSMLEFRNERDQRAYRMYISGDTLVHEDLKEIPRRYRNIDLALMHLGGTRVPGVLVTMDARQGIEALRIIRPDLAIPIHYNDYDVFKEPLEEFARAVERAGWKDKVRYLYHGDTYEFAPRGCHALQEAALMGARPLV
jgi:L-ascorbate metabolism protein UlaG (beta-lactamase superfamily)